MATLNSYDESLLPAQPLNQTDQSVMAGPPAEPTPIPEIVAALRTVTQLDGLSEEEYTWLATHGTERVGPDRAILFRDNDPAPHSEGFHHGNRVRLILAQQHDRSGAAQQRRHALAVTRWNAGDGHPVGKAETGRQRTQLGLVRALAEDSHSRLR